jgi:hypothetical protein
VRAERDSIGNEIDPHYFHRAKANVEQELAQISLFAPAPSLTVSEG